MARQRVSALGLEREVPLDDKSAAFEVLETRAKTLRQRRRTTIEDMFSDRGSDSVGGDGGSGAMQQQWRPPTADLSGDGAAQESGL